MGAAAGGDVRRFCLLAALAWCSGAAAWSQSGTLETAAQAARQSWYVHDVSGLLAGSSGIILQIPGADPSSPLGRPQAAELLRRYLGGARERSVTVVSVREVEPGIGFVELDRRYVVSGTADQRRESLFLGFRRVEGRWVLAELRSVGG